MKPEKVHHISYVICFMCITISPTRDQHDSTLNRFLVISLNFFSILPTQRIKTSFLENDEQEFQMVTNKIFWPDILQAQSRKQMSEQVKKKIK